MKIQTGWFTLLVATLITMAALVPALVLGSAAPQQETDNTAYLPYLAGSRSLILSGVQFQNLDAMAPAAISATFRPQTGGSQEMGWPAVNPMAAANVLPSQHVQDDSAAVARSPRSLGAIARHEWLRQGNGAAIYSNAHPDTELHVPLIVKDFVHQCSILSIQNTSLEAVATVAVTFRPLGSPTVQTVVPLQIQPGTSLTRDVCGPGFGGLAAGFVGSAVLQSEVPIAAVAMVHYEGHPKGSPVFAFEAVPIARADTTLFVPLFRRNWYGTSGIAVLNPGAEAVDVTVTYRGTLGSCTGAEGTQNAAIPPRAAVVFYQGDPSLPLPPGPCAGAATLQATGGIVAVVNEAKGGSAEYPDTTGAYNAVSLSDASTQVALPLFRKEHLPAYSLSTGVQAMNVGTTTASAEIVLRGASGDPLPCPASACRQSIAPGTAYTWYPPTMAGVPSNVYGSAIITSDQPLVVIVNDESRTVALDSALYNGLAMPDAPVPATPTPSVPTSTPETETPGAETPTPETETPSAETPTPGDETPTPETETPSAETPTPGDETPTPETETPSAETPTPGDETPTPDAATPAPPANDDLAAAAEIGELPFTHQVDTTGASDETDEEAGSCDEGSLGVWYKYTATADITMRLTTEGSSFDTVLSLWEGADHPLTEVACNDDASLDATWSSLQRALTDGETVFVKVEGKSGASGEAVLNVEESMLPPWITLPSSAPPAFRGPRVVPQSVAHAAVPG